MRRAVRTGLRPARPNRDPSFHFDLRPHQETNMPTDPNKAATAVDTAAKGQSSNALIVQNYCLTALSQPNVDLGGSAGLIKYQDEINKALGGAKDSAHKYLNVVLPQAIVTIANIDAYFATQNALAEALQPNTPAQTAIALLSAVQEQATTFKTQAAGVTGDLQALRDQFNRTSADMSKSASDLSIAVDGDNGVLKSISSQLSDIDGKINGAITGVVLSSLAIVGGVIMIGVGALAEAVTGGLATALIIGGIAVAAVGVGGEVGSSIMLAKLLDMKSGLLNEQARLNSEVTLAAGLSSGLKGLSSSAGNAATAAQGMANAWSLLGDDLGNLINDLNSGKTTVDALRTLFTIAAQGQVKVVQGDVATIRGQLAGVNPTVDTSMTAGALVRQQIAKAA
jgi:hypothetical protein